MLAAVAFTIILGASSKVDRLLHTFRDDIEALAWTPRGTVVAVTKNAVTEWPGGMSRRLRRFNGQIDDPICRPAYRLLLNASKTKAIGSGFVLNLKTLSTYPLARAAAWEGDRLVEIDAPTRGRYRMFRSRHPVPVAPGWFVLGISDDLHLALASRRVPFDDDETFLLRLDSRTGRASILTSNKEASDDHQWLSQVQESGLGGDLIVHTKLLAADFTKPYLARSELRPIDLGGARKQPLPNSPSETSALVEWIDPATPWTLVRRRLMLDQSGGFDAAMLDLWNSKSGETVPLAKVTDYWTVGNDLRGLGPTVSAYALDWPSRRIAYVVASRKDKRLLVASFSRLLATRGKKGEGTLADTRFDLAQCDLEVARLLVARAGRVVRDLNTTRARTPHGLPGSDYFAPAALTLSLPTRSGCRSVETL